MSVQRLTWREIGLLQVGERVIFSEAMNVHPSDLSEPDPHILVPDVIVPAGATAVVRINTLRKDGLIALEPDDRALIAELKSVSRDVIFLNPPFGDSPPLSEADVWDELGPIGKIIPEAR
jgi:hypothetical protein